MTLIEPGWAEALIDFLRTPGMSVLLLIIGGAAIYVELHAPGVGVGAFVAAVAFLLFFWSHCLGTVGWLAIVLFLAGVACMLLEVFVLPGMGVFAVGGGGMVLVSLVLASQTFILPHNKYEMEQLQRSLLTVASAVVGLIVAAAVLQRWLPQAPLFHQVFLEPPAGEEAQGISRREMLVDLENLVGAQGVTATSAQPGRKGPLRQRAGRCHGRRRIHPPQHADRRHRGPRQPRRRPAGRGMTTVGHPQAAPTARLSRPGALTIVSIMVSFKNGSH